MKKKPIFQASKYLFITILAITWIYFLIKSVKSNSLPEIILILLSINLLFLLTVILIKTKYLVFFSSSISILLIYGCLNVIFNYDSLILFSITILINGAVFLILVINLTAKLSTEKSMNELSIEQMSEECNILENQYKEINDKNKSLKIESERMEKMSITAFLMGSSADENEAANHLVNETAQILGVDKSLFSKYSSKDDKSYIIANNGYKNINNKSTDTVDDWIRTSKLPVLINNVKMETKIHVRRYSNFSSAESIIAAPVLIANEVYGVLRMEHEKQGSFTNDNLRVLDFISDIGSIVFGNLFYLNKIKALAQTDGITGLYVHRYMIEKLKDEIQKFNKEKINISMIMLDIDDFKYFNDTYGHQFGDLLLIEVAKIIKDSIREKDFPVRYGGDEFMIILPQTGIKSVKTLARRLLDKVKSTDLNSLSQNNNFNEKKPLTISIGAGIFKKSYKNPTKFIDKIDNALYSAKQNGKNRIELVR